MKTQLHCNDCGAAIEVKTHGMQLADGGTDEQRETAWNQTAEIFWHDAKQIAEDCGYDGVMACGRSAGWCAPHRNFQPRTFENDLDSPAFLEFADAIQACMENVPKLYSDTLAGVMAEDLYAEAEDERKKNKRHARRLAIAGLVDALRECVTDPGALAIRDPGKYAIHRLNVITETARDALTTYQEKTS